jgi:hypothetical protein
MQCSEHFFKLCAMAATFNGRSILEGNGHTQVTYLMTSNDADVVQAYRALPLTSKKSTGDATMVST